MIIDRYTKAVLTLIAISLFVISLNPWIAPIKAYAEMGWTDTKYLGVGQTVQQAPLVISIAGDKKGVLPKK